MPGAHRLERRGDEGNQGPVVAAQSFKRVQSTLDVACSKAKTGRVVLLAAPDTCPVLARTLVEDPVEATSFQPHHGFQFGEGLFAGLPVLAHVHDVYWV